MIRSGLLCCVAVLMLPSCTYLMAESKKETGVVKPVLSFTHMEPDVVAAKQVLFIDTTQASELSYVSSELASLAVRDDLQRALSEYFASRFVGRGYDSVVEVVLEDLQESVRIEQDDHYLFKAAELNRKEHIDVTFKVLVQVVDGQGRRGQGVRLSFKKNLMVGESVTLNEREIAYVRFIERLMQDVDREMLQVLHTELGL